MGFWGRFEGRREGQRADVRVEEAVRVGGAVASDAEHDRERDGLCGERDGVRYAVDLSDPHRGTRAGREDSVRSVEERRRTAERRRG